MSYDIEEIEEMFAEQQEEFSEFVNIVHEPSSRVRDEFSRASDEFKEASNKAVYLHGAASGFGQVSSTIAMPMPKEQPVKFRNADGHRISVS